MTPRKETTPVLVISPPSGANFEFTLDKIRVTLGRSSRNDICLNDPFASRLHAEIRREKDAFFVFDNGSANGTYHNGERIAGSAPLKPGDIVRIGETEIQFTDGALGTASASFKISDIDIASQAEVTIVGRARSADTHESLLSVFTEIAARDQQTESGKTGVLSQVVAAGPRRDLLAVVSKVVETLLVEQTLDETLNAVLGLVFDAVKAERGYLFLTDSDKELILKSSRMAGTGGPDDEVKLSRSICDKVIGEGASVLTSDAQQDPRFAASRSIHLGNIRSIMAVPLSTNETVLGMIYVDNLYATNRFSQEDLNVLTTIARVAAIKIENSRLIEAQLEKRRLDEELKVASEIQLSLHPARLPKIDGFELVGISFPCREIGGDYYDFIPRRDGRLIVALGDVSGKGTGAALMMSSLHAAIRAQSQTGRPVEEIVSEVNAYIVDNSPENKFLTLFCAELDPATGHFSYTNAGHNPALLVHADGSTTELNADGIPVGIAQGFQYCASESLINPGEVLVIYSDGITESVNEQDDEFGMERLIEIVAKYRTQGASRIRDRIDEAVGKFVGKAAPVDDMTLVILKRLET